MIWIDILECYLIVLLLDLYISLQIIKELISVTIIELDSVVMMWLRYILMSFGSCMALRTHSAVGVAEEKKLYKVEVALSLTEPEAVKGSSIDIAVNGVRHLSRVHPTQVGSPVVLHYIPRGGVVTAHVHNSEDACAYWVGTGRRVRTVGDWKLVFAVSDEDDEKTPHLFEAYVKVVTGKGQPITVELNHVVARTLPTATQNEVFKFPSLQKGTLVKVVSASGDTCLHRVGKRESKCTLDHSWGLLLGSATEKKNDLDEGYIGNENVKKYTLEITLEPTKVARVIELELNGLFVTERETAVTREHPIKVHHVEGGSVITAMSHTTGEACSAYVGTGIQNLTCAGWRIDFVLQDESDKHLDKYDVSYTVQRLSTNTSGTWDIKLGELRMGTMWGPVLFPTIEGYQTKGDLVVPITNGMESQTCAHEVGGNATSCECGGWLFTIESYLNMNPDEWQSIHWEYIDDGSDDWERPQQIKISAFDTTESSSKSWFECVALQEMTYRVPPPGATDKLVKEHHNMFKPMDLSYHYSKHAKKNATKIKSATVTVEFEISDAPVHKGFKCTVYDKDDNKMCEVPLLVRGVIKFDTFGFVVKNWITRMFTTGKFKRNDLDDNYRLHYGN